MIKKIQVFHLGNGCFQKIELGRLEAKELGFLIVWECRKIQCKFDAQVKKFISLQAAIKELLSKSVKRI